MMKPRSPVLFQFILFVGQLIVICKSQNEPITCPPTGTINYPDPESCAGYYVCTEGTLHHFTCPDGTYWNQNLGICDLPENVDCSRYTVTTNAPVETTTPIEVTTGTPEPDCPDEEGVFLIPYPGNCSLYFICYDNGESYEIESCAEDLLFDPVDGRCEPADDANCEISPPSQSTISNPSTSTQIITSPPGDYDCPPDVEFIYMPHPLYCTMFYWCEFGEFGGESNCGTGLWFDFDAQACVSPYESDCDKEPRPTTIAP